MGHKGSVVRPRCIRPGRARTQVLFYSFNSILFHQGIRALWLVINNWHSL